MIPELGKYAVPVLSAYGFGLLLILGLTVLSLLQARKSRKMLNELEARRKKHG